MEETTASTPLDYGYDYWSSVESYSWPFFRVSQDLIWVVRSGSTLFVSTHLGAAMGAYKRAICPDTKNR